MLSLSIILFASIFCRSQALTNVGGVLLQDTVWSSTGNANPYYLVNDVQVPYNSTLTIQAGVQIIFGSGNLEILIKGVLKVQGTANNPVCFYNGSAADTKWMITFQSTNLTQSLISHAVFTGPKKGLQTKKSAPGLQQNAGILVIQNTAFVGETTIETNGRLSGNYPLPRVLPAPSLKLTSVVINDSMVSTGNDMSEPILIINSKLFNATARPAAALGGIQFLNSKLQTLTIIMGKDYYGHSGILEFNDSTVDNAVKSCLNEWCSSSLHIRAFRSVIRHSSFKVAAYSYEDYIQNSFIIDSSTFRNVSIDASGLYYYYDGAAIPYSIFMNNSIFHTGDIRLGSFPKSAMFQNSKFQETNIAAGTSDRYGPWPGINITNVIFQNGSLILPVSNVAIMYSTIVLGVPPLVLGDNSIISCSSIKRFSSVLQASTTGIQATTITITQSSISSFEVGLQVTPLSMQTSSISSSNFISNSQFNIQNVGVYDVQAAGNWWGSSNDTAIHNKIYDYWDNINYGQVLYSNYSNVKLPAENDCPSYSPV
ncbi:unnamed protein product [Rotaria socialis]|uniref:Uncharacterized protein n=1 Tax=Rotaria socialis TaxID=392032 RepID=A0A821D128_9BILA|nr:unnamed protein product [Rotaria socialis]CAF4614402.1 unnamed protein product [Rotaria socialis]